MKRNNLPIGPLVWVVLALPAADTPLPESARAMDANGNDRIDEGEAGGALRNGFALIDANGDGALSGA
jgi:hypothetical protein